MYKKPTPEDNKIAAKKQKADSIHAMLTRSKSSENAIISEKSSKSFGFFEESILIYLIYPFSSTIDFKKIDARINTKPDIEEIDSGLEYAGCLLNHRWISVPKSSHKETIEKLKNHSDIFVIDGNKTAAWENYFKTSRCPFSRNP